MNKKVFFIVLALLIIYPAASWARDWYVRPAGGQYGTQDGTSYDNAWNGLHAIKWLEGGVQPGDTLWVCGLHVWDMKTKSYIDKQAVIPTINGASDTQRIMIRGDYSNDPGIVWGAYRMSSSPWVDEGGGVWSTLLAANSFPEWFFQDIGKPKPDSYIVLNRQKSIDGVRANPGSFYSETYTAGSKLYVKTTDSLPPQGRIYANRYGYRFNLADNKFITFYKLKMFNFFRISGIKPVSPPSNITWQGCTLTHGEHSIIWLYDGMDNMKVIDCELAWAGNGIYNISSTLDKAASNYHFKGNYIHDMGVREATQNNDGHCVGAQGGRNGIIEDNVCVNCGTGPLIYTGASQIATNNIIRRNLVKDPHTLGGANGYGIALLTTNLNTSDKSGNIVVQNIVINAKIAFRFHWEQVQLVANNVAYNCEIGLESKRNYNGLGANVYFVNNVFLNTKQYHINWDTGASNFVIYADRNIYYPSTGAMFRYRGKDYTWDGWRALTRPSCLFDPKSFALDPKFKNITGKFTDALDFMLKSDSPAIGTGQTVQVITSDFAGGPILGTPDIGAFQHTTIPRGGISATAPGSGPMPAPGVPGTP
ncbi:MAG: right-handed parallel beta-helix repeat-containing protein [Thermodesulfobacteriota bacterium]